MFRKAFFLILLAVPFAAARQDYEATHTEVHPMTAGSTLRLQLSVGDVHIVKGSDAQNLHLRYTVRTNRESNLRDVTSTFRTQSDGGTIVFHEPFRGKTSIDVELEVPDPTTLEVHLKVGDLRIEGIHGDKDLAVRVGDIRVSGSDPDYRSVHADAGIGEVTLRPDGWQSTLTNYKDSGWLGRKLSYDGSGKYDLRAQVSVGDIEIR
jgi:hypothetical protein